MGGTEDPPWLFCFWKAMGRKSFPWPFFLEVIAMVIIMKKSATEGQIDAVIDWIDSVGYRAHPSRGVERTIIGVVGDDRDKAQLKSAEHLPGVEKIMPILKP